MPTRRATRADEEEHPLKDVLAAIQSNAPHVRSVCYATRDGRGEAVRYDALLTTDGPEGPCGHAPGRGAILRAVLRRPGGASARQVVAYDAAFWEGECYEGGRDSGTYSTPFALAVAALQQFHVPSAGPSGADASRPCWCGAAC